MVPEGVLGGDGIAKPLMVVGDEVRRANIGSEMLSSLREGERRPRAGSSGKYGAAMKLMILGLTLV